MGNGEWGMGVVNGEWGVVNGKLFGFNVNYQLLITNY